MLQIPENTDASLTVFFCLNFQLLLKFPFLA